MKRNFTDSPAAWLRASRVFQSPADYASAIERFQSRGHSAATYVGTAILAVMALLVIAGVL